MNSVRLTCATKPHVSETWLLKRGRKGLVLLDEDEQVVTSIPAGEASLRILFPSFWASRKYLVISGKNGENFLFEPRQKALANIRTLVDDCARKPIRRRRRLLIERKPSATSSSAAVRSCWE